MSPQRGGVVKPVFKARGELAGLINDHGWSATPLGPLDGWPPSLVTATRLLLASPVPIVMLWGEQGVMIYNDAYSEFAGNRHPALLGSNVREGWPEVADFNDNVMRVGLSGGTLSYADQLMVLNRTGTPADVWLDLEYSPVFGDDGAPAGVIAIVHEITVARRAAKHAQALVRLTERLRLLDDPAAIAGAGAAILGETLGAVRAGYGTLTTDGDVVNDCPEWAPPGRTPLEGPRRFADYGTWLATLEAGEIVAVGDALTDPRTAAARDRLVARSARALINAPVLEQGRVVAILYLADDRPREWGADELALIREVAERTRTAVERARGAAELSASSALFRFLDALGLAASQTVDPDAILALTARMTAQHLGVSVCAYADMDADHDGFTIRGDWAAPGSASIVGHYRLADFGALAVRELSAGRPLIVNDNRVELAPYEAATFQSIGITATVCMPLVKQGRLTALMAIHHARAHHWTAEEINAIHEVTERSWAHVERARAEADLRASAAQLRELNETLEQRVEERTDRLMEAEAALRQAQKMEAVGQLTGGLAHDFNNLLTGIGGSLEIMQARMAQGRLDTLDRYFTVAQGAVRRAAALTHRLLAFSRRQTLDPRPTDLNRLVAGLEELVRRTMGPGVTVEVVGASGLWPTLVDPNQLENALLNLCINARDAMPGGGQLTIETANKWLDDRAAREQDLPVGQYVSLCVTDTGTGMTPEVKARAFDPFFTTKPLGEGTGLGLSMIYGFARQSGGQVRIYTELGQGTTMCVYLPRHDVPAEAEDIGAAPTPLRADGAGEVVLVIDDEPSVRMLVAEVLAEGGYAAIEAADGPTGLKVLESGTRVDLLITDVGLPGGMNGRQVAEAARRLRPELRILFITGYAENAVLSHGHLGHGISLITKPFQMDALSRRIGDALKR